jgi:hypothetical protein
MAPRFPYPRQPRRQPVQRRRAPTTPGSPILADPLDPRQMVLPLPPPAGPRPAPDQEPDRGPDDDLVPF